MSSNSDCGRSAISRAMVFAETLCPRIDARRQGDAFAEEADHDEVQRSDVGRRIPIDLQLPRLGGWYFM